MYKFWIVPCRLWRPSSAIQLGVQEGDLQSPWSNKKRLLHGPSQNLPQRRHETLLTAGLTPLQPSTNPIRSMATTGTAKISQKKTFWLTCLVSHNDDKKSNHFNSYADHHHSTSFIIMYSIFFRFSPSRFILLSIPIFKAVQFATIVHRLILIFKVSKNISWCMNVAFKMKESMEYILHWLAF